MEWKEAGIHLLARASLELREEANLYRHLPCRSWANKKHQGTLTEPRSR